MAARNRPEARPPLLALPLLALAGAACYLYATMSLLSRLASGDEPRAAPPATWLLAALALHGLVLYRTVWAGDGPSLGVSEAASLVAWVGAIGLALAAAARPVGGLAVLALPLAAVLDVVGVLWPRAPVPGAPRGLGFEVHFATSVAAYGVLLLAACQSLVLAFLERRLAARRPGRLLGALPPLAVQETLLFQLLGIGFFLLSLSLVSGLVFVDDLLAQHLVHKTVLSVIAWALFGVLLWGRWRRGWRGRTALRLVIGGFVTLGVAYFGSKAVLEVVLGRHWFAG